MTAKVIAQPEGGTVPIASIVLGTDGRLAKEDKDSFTTLMDSIDKDGLLEPLVVWELPDGKYQLAAGYRRYRALKKLGWKDVPVRVTDSESATLTENVIRLGVSFREVITLATDNVKAGIAKAQVARSIGRTAAYVGMLVKCREGLVPELWDIFTRSEEEDMTVNQASQLAGMPTKRQAEAWDAMKEAKSEVRREASQGEAKVWAAAHKKAAINGRLGLKLDAARERAIAERTEYSRGVSDTIAYLCNTDLDVPAKSFFSEPKVKAEEPTDKVG